MKSLEELRAIKERMQNQVEVRLESESGTRIVVGMATCGIAAGARPVLQAFAQGIADKKLENVMVTQTGCIGLCQYEPIVEIYQPGKEKVTYAHMTAEKAAEVIDQHLIRGQIVSEYLIKL
ncbi:MAG: (2Fe-2S) ferredoxin domain-containing protein [Oscillospiraceae bacterium]|nr:(2Fe-2S) ferredoxin domain-containing protein [Oscillospiraceae bacterium]